MVFSPRQRLATTLHALPSLPVGIATERVNDHSKTHKKLSNNLVERIRGVSDMDITKRRSYEIEWEKVCAEKKKQQGGVRWQDSVIHMVEVSR